MAVYRYLATRPGVSGSIRGEFAADSEAQVRHRLRHMGLLPARVDELTHAARGGPRPITRALNRFTAARRTIDLAEFYEGLAALLTAGVPLLESLELLARGKRGRASTLCRQIADGVRRGGTLSQAMAARPAWFSPVDQALVRSAQHSGDLDATLSSLASHRSRSGELAHRVAGTLAYPLLLACFGVGVVVFLSTATLPQLAAVVRDSGGELPAATRLLLAAGGTIAAWWWLALPVLVATVGACAWAVRLDALAQVRLRVPILGLLIRRSQIGSASLLLARLLRAGLPLGESISLVEPTVTNRAIASALVALRSGLANGAARISKVSVISRLDPVFARVVEVGEESGELDAALERIGERYVASARRLVDRLATLLEPMVILVLAGLIGFVVYAAVMPMLQVSRSF